MIDPEVLGMRKALHLRQGRSTLVDTQEGQAQPIAHLHQGAKNVTNGVETPLRRRTIDSSGPNAAQDPLRGAKEPRRGGDGAGTAVITRPKTQTKKPSMYRVLLLNDDYTPMEFVVIVLRKYFNKTDDEATHIMLHVHHHGVGECGVFTYEVAETKVTQVMDFARKNQHPLQCIMEKK